MATYSVNPNESIRCTLRYEDADLVVCDKPAHVVSTPGLGHEDDTLLNGLFAKFGTKLQKLGKARDFGLLHRLDRETSGLIVCALHAAAYDGLRAQFEARTVRKFYYAICGGTPRELSGVVRKPIVEVTGRELGIKSGPRASMKLAKISGRSQAGQASKQAVTAYRVLASGPMGSLIECRPVTGRLHQVRVHLEAIGAPIFGDDLYAPRAIAKGRSRLALHSHRISFEHPVSGEKVDVKSPLPDGLKRLLTALRLPTPGKLAEESGRSTARKGAQNAQMSDVADDGPVTEPEELPDGD